MVHWTRVQGTALGLTAGTVAVNLLPAQHLPETHLRLRGEWAAGFAGALTDARGVIVTAGIVEVPEGTGTTVLWSPFTDGDAPWIWWDTMHLSYEEYVVDGNYSSNLSDGRRVVDSKAMRKIRNTEMQLVFENTTNVAAEAANCFFAGRVLSGS